MQMGDDPDQSDEIRPITPFEAAALSLIVIVFWSVVVGIVASGWLVYLELLK